MQLAITYFGIFAILYYFVNKYITQNDKVTRNIVSAFHAILVINTYIENKSFTDHVAKMSITYYLFDGLQIVVNYIKHKVIDYTYIIHHTLTILLFVNVDELVEPYLYKGFVAAEVSNIPLYIVYHLLITKHEDKYLIRSAMELEIVTYFICRIIMMGEIVYYLYHMSYYYWFAVSIPFYLMGVVWMCKISVGYVRLSKSIREHSADDRIKA